MLFLNRGCVLPLITGVSNFLLQSSVVTPIALRNYAARKGTRERKKKQKVKVEVQKVGFIPRSQLKKEKLLLNRGKLRHDDSTKPTPVDNVYIMKFYKWDTHPFIDAAQFHRETHHPEMYNQPNAKLYVDIELNMQAEKKTRFVDDFHRIAAMPHKFDHGEERSIIAFTKLPEQQQQMKDAGIQLTGGVELIKQIQQGAVSLSDFQYVLAHPNILPELVPLRGLMKKKFPNPKIGTLDVDLPSAVHRFLHGMSYSAVKDEQEKDYALIKTFIGTLNMDINHLEENFESLIKDIYSMKPKRDGDFITRCILWSPPSREKLQVNYSAYISSQSEAKDDDEDEDVAAAV